MLYIFGFSCFYFTILQPLEILDDKRLRTPLQTPKNPIWNLQI